MFATKFVASCALHVRFIDRKTALIHDLNRHKAIEFVANFARYAIQYSQAGVMRAEVMAAKTFQARKLKRRVG